MTEDDGAEPHDSSGVCEAATRSGTLCQRPAGWGTDHAGEGRCKLHGGAKPVLHGRYSQIKSKRIRALQARFEADPDPTDLLPEVAALRAFVVDLVDRWEDIYGPDGALLAWHQSFLTGATVTSPKPRQMPDFSSVTDVIDRVGRMVDRVEKQRLDRAIGPKTFRQLLAQMGDGLVAALREAELDDAAFERVLAAVRRIWGKIDTENPSAGAGTNRSGGGPTAT